MAENPFSVRVPSAFEALMAGDAGYNSGRQFAQDQALRTAGPDIASGNYESAIARLMQGGNLQGALAVASLNNNNRDFQFRQQEAQRAQGNTDRSFGLQQQAMNNPNIQKDENGNFVRINKDGTVAAVLPVTGAPAPNNPFLGGGGAMNESQSKDALYANRMMNAEKTFRDPKVIDAGMSVAQRGMGAIPGVGNFLVSDQYQKYDQAQRDFINATLRRESGAVISPSEFDNAAKQYFPRPGDSQEVLKQKQQNRVEAIKGIGAGGGKNYKPAYNFDQAGNIVERGAAAQGGPVRVSSPQERNALPAGTQYIAPDGSIRTKQ